MVDDAEITISLKYYDELVADAKKLAKLEAAGVDNWDGYSIAFEENDD